jgi:CheY-like chemotaxis protein
MVLDRVLPRLRADEVAERLRGQAATRAVPLFVLAAREDLGPRSALFRECLPLPLDRRMLAAALERLGAPVH